MHAARYWHREGEGHIRCDLCPHGCRIAVGRRGRCGVRHATDSGLEAIGYGRVSSAGLDPIEKKPLYHFHPGTSIFSIGGWGCNLSCSFCQNWSISQRQTDGGREFSAQDIVAQAAQCSSIGIAYTYNEPSINFEFVYECARLARDAGLSNVLVTNGYIRPDPAGELLPLIDAANIDIKSMDDSFYREYCGASLEPVLSFAIQAFRAGCHIELTNLLIPDLNDAENLVHDLARWIGSKLSADTVLHLSAYHPEYKLRKPPTPVGTLTRAFDICRKQLRHVYLGNVQTAEGQSTRCIGCGSILISRRGYAVDVTGVNDGKCSVCGASTGIVF